MEESDVMGALMRLERTACVEKYDYPGFPRTPLPIPMVCVRFPPLMPHFLSNVFAAHYSSPLSAVAAARRELAQIDRQLLQRGANLSPMEVVCRRCCCFRDSLRVTNDAKQNAQERALFCALYARLADPMLDEARRRIRCGVSMHVAGGITFTDDPQQHFADVKGCRFKEEACIACMLLGLAPWDNYIRMRVAAAERGSDPHPVFAVVVCLFFGWSYCIVAGVDA